MHVRTQIWLLGARSCVLGGVATTFGVFGHVHAGGGDPTAAQVLGVWLAASVLCGGFLMREAGWFRIAALLLVGQLLIHVGLMWMVSMPTMSAMPGMPGMAMPGMSLVPSGGMVAGHLVAAAIAGLWLWRGERALWSLIAQAGGSFLLLRRPFVAVSVTLPDVYIATDLLPLWGLRVTRHVGRRGPPPVAVP
jgi:hypothetical protein